jgi:aspartokinase-like uncharacterized kinase
VDVGIAVVVKVGGGMLAREEDLKAVLAEIAAASSECPLLVVPGGGPFADRVRDVDRRIGLTPDAAHWMAVLAMDQYAHLISARLSTSVLVESATEIDVALQQGRLPILAPYRWLREVDPLPHSWDVTSDSISAWVAGRLGAVRLVLVKPPYASGPALVDPRFEHVLPSHIHVEIVPANRIEELRAALRIRRV